MQGEHQDSEWYQNPGESVEDIKLKREKAQKAGLMQTPVRANSRLTAMRTNTIIINIKAFVLMLLLIHFNEYYPLKTQPQLPSRQSWLKIRQLSSSIRCL